MGGGGNFLKNLIPGKATKQSSHDTTGCVCVVEYDFWQEILCQK